MNFRNLSPKQRITIGIAWLFLVHALLNVAVGLYRCHDVVPRLTDHLAAVLPAAQTCLLVAWLFFGPANLSKRFCGFIAGHLMIFAVYSNLLLPGFKTMRPDSNWQWIYFHYSGPGAWLVKLPVLFIAVGLVFMLVKTIRSVPRECAESDSLVDGPSVKKTLVQFDVADLLLWTIVCCLLLAVYATPTYDGWTSQLVEVWSSVYKLKTIVDWCAISTALFWALAFYGVLISCRIRDLYQRIVLQVGLTMIAGFIFDWQFYLLEPIKDLPRQTYFAPSFVFIVSSSLIVIEILGDPKFGLVPQGPLKKIEAPDQPIGGMEENAFGEVPSIEI